MKKLIRVRCTLIVLQLLSITVASVILLVYYNPWIEQIIDEAERSGNAGKSFTDQIYRTENEEIVIIFMSAATIVVSLVGIVGTIRGPPRGGQAHCLLNFYMSTLIIFLFVIFVALCGTVWELAIKLQQHQQISHSPAQSHPTPTATPTITYNLVDFNLPPVETNRSTTPPMFTSNLVPQTPTSSVIGGVTWWYIIKSFVYIILSASLYATALRLTRRIMESFDDRYLSANDDADDLNSEASSSSYMNNNNRPFGWGLGGVIANGGNSVTGGGLYNSAALGKSLDGSSSGCESVRNPFRHI